MNKNNLPTVATYGDYSSGNYGAHCLRVSIPATRKEGKGITIFFSYETPIAFRQEGKTYVIKNQWGTTTGKHLNLIDGGDKSNRLDPDEFEKAYAKAVRQA